MKIIISPKGHVFGCWTEPEDQQECWCEICQWNFTRNGKEFHSWEKATEWMKKMSKRVSGKFEVEVEHG